MSKNLYIEGKISLSTRKTGYITNLETNETIEIQEKNLNKAFPWDLVKVEILPEKIGDNLQGKVIEIIKRNKEEYVGVVQKNSGGCFMLPDNPKMYVDFYIPKDQCEKAKEGDKIVVKIDSWDRANPTGKIVKVLGQKGLHEVEMQAIVYDRGFDTDFPKAVEEEARELSAKWHKIPESEIEKRRDMRETTTFTIDPKSAKDFDDALSLEKLDNGNYQIGIHIADVSHFVTPGTELDKEAFERSFSVYLVDRTIPMLPEVLSNDLCSLNPEEEKLAFSAVFEISPNGKIHDKWFGRTVIKSDKRFSYEEAQEVLDKGEGVFIEELKTMHSIASIYRKEKFNNGAIRFEKDEFEFELDDKGVPIAIHKKEHIDTHWVIEEFMLLANRSVAMFIDEKSEKKPRMYRVHNQPESDKLYELQSFVKALGYVLEIAPDGSISAKDLNNLLQEVAGKPEETLISTAAVKTMSKALYSPKNSGHFGLAFDDYTHFTSPIRRYPDLVVHRILAEILSGKGVSDKEEAMFPKIAEQASNQEVAAADAERTSIKYKQVEFMKNHIGDEFDGVISGVAKWGAYVLLNDTGAEGLVHVTNMGNDFYEFDEKNYRIIGKQSGKVYTLGDPVRVKIADANLEEKKLDMRFVEEAKK